MPAFLARARHAAVTGALAVTAAAGASAPPCVKQSLPGFTICVPPNWALKTGGVDSAAGRFSSGNLTVIYDFGLYSDPLRLPEGALAATETAVTVDDKAARQVSYTVAPAGQVALHVLGIHVPGIRATSIGALRLTVRAESSDAAQLSEARSAFATIRFNAAIKP